jgi:hypothetical protein
MAAAQLINLAAGFGLDLPSHGYRCRTASGNVDPIENYATDVKVICGSDRYCRMAASCWGPRAANQQLAKRFDLLGDEIAECPHARCSPHVAVKYKIEMQSNHWCRTE